MNSESWANATLVGVAFGSHWRPSQSPGKVCPKQLQLKTLCPLYFKGCLCVVVTWSLNDWLFVLSKEDLKLWASPLGIAQGRRVPRLHLYSSCQGEEREWQKGNVAGFRQRWYIVMQSITGIRQGEGTGLWAGRAKDFPTEVCRTFRGAEWYWGRGPGLEMKRIWFPGLLFPSLPQPGPCLRSERAFSTLIKMTTRTPTMQVKAWNIA